VQILGGREFAMRIWLDPVRLAAREVTAPNVLTAIRASLSCPRRQDGKNEFVAYASRRRPRCKRRNPSARTPGSRFRRRHRAPARRADVEYGPDSARLSASPSTAREGVFLGVFGSPAPTRSTRRPRWKRSCRKSSANCRRMVCSSGLLTPRQHQLSIEEVFTTITRRR
jgi:hypothetical protein